MSPNMKLIQAVAAIAALSLAMPVLADDREEKELKATIAANMRALELPVTEVRDTELEGFFEVVLDGSQSLFVTRDGRHFLTGDLYRMGRVGEGLAVVNVSEESRSKRRKELMDSIDESEMVVFSPPAENVKAVVNVFTDIDCGYCRKLHQEIPELNRLGIAVRYLAYPRAGVSSRSYDKIVSAWCAENPQEALTLAKLGQEIEPIKCDNPVAAQYRLGQEIGVTGTPALVYEDGTLVPGYLPAERLAQQMGILN